MRQKFLIHTDREKNELTIKEYANLERESKGREIITIEKEAFSLLCKETYDTQKMISAIKKGKDILISELRTDNLFPIGLYVDKIADTIMELYGSNHKDSYELLFDDKEFLAINPVVPE